MTAEREQKGVAEMGGEKKLRSILKEKKGVTLVELVVAFALIAMFAAGVCQAASSAMKVYQKIRGRNQARQTADTLMDKIVGEIQGGAGGNARGDRRRRSVRK